VSLEEKEKFVDTNVVTSHKIPQKKCWTAL